MKTLSDRRITAIRSGRTAAACCLTLALVFLSAVGAAQAPKIAKPSQPLMAAPSSTTPAPVSSDTQADYVIGPTDVLSIVFWGEKELSNEVTVRPDGKISLPLLNDVVAAGLTPEQLRQRLTERAKTLVKDPVVAVVVKQVNNNRVFVTGQVMRPGPYVLSGPNTVLQLLALAGGFTEFADRSHILITRIEDGVQRAFKFNYDDALKHQDLSRNLILKVGDTVVVP